MTAEGAHRAPLQLSHLENSLCKTIRTVADDSIFHEHVRNQARVQGTRSDGDHVRRLDRRERGRKWMRVRGVELHATDAVSRGADTRFTFNPTAVFELCPEPHVGSGRRINHALDSENFRRQTYGLYEVSGYTGQRCQEQVAEAVIVKSAVAVESEPEEARHQMFVLGEGDHAVADIARRQNAEFLAKTSGASSVVSDGNDDGEVRLALLQTAQES